MTENEIDAEVSVVIVPPMTDEKETDEILTNLNLDKALKTAFENSASLEGTPVLLPISPNRPYYQSRRQASRKRKNTTLPTLRLPGSLIPAPSPGDDVIKTLSTLHTTVKDLIDKSEIAMEEYVPALSANCIRRCLWQSGGSYEVALEVLRNHSYRHHQYQVFLEYAATSSASSSVNDDNDTRSQHSTISHLSSNSRNNRRKLSQRSKTSRTATVGGSKANTVETVVVTSSATTITAEKVLGQCNICLEDVQAKDNAALNCKHLVCFECCEQYLCHKIDCGDITHDRLVCPVSTCAFEYNPYHVYCACGEPTLKKLLQFRISRSFEISPFGRYCPNTKCGAMLIANVRKRKNECPQCHTKICIRCNKKYHAGFCKPKISFDFAHVRYVYWAYLKGIKKCPRCRFQIEKTQGCNHMTCAKCRYEFCWLCKRRYTSGHFDGPLSCSSYRPFDIWGPNIAVRTVTKTIGGSTLLALAGFGSAIALPFIVYHNRKDIKGLFFQ